MTSLQNILRGDRNLVSIRKTSARLPFAPLHHRPTANVLHKGAFLSIPVLRAERKHIKSATVNRGSDSTGRSPLNSSEKIRALSSADKCTLLTWSFKVSRWVHLYNIINNPLLVEKVDSKPHARISHIQQQLLQAVQICFPQIWCRCWSERNRSTYAF